MRKLTFFLSFALVFGLAYGALAQTHHGVISIDGITNTLPSLPGYDPINELSGGNTHVVSIRYDFRANSNLGRWQGSNSFELYSPDGANWVSLVATNGPMLSEIAGVAIYKKYYTSTNAGISFTSTASGGSTQPGPSTGANSRVAFSFSTVDLVNNGFVGGVSNGIPFTLTFSSLVADTSRHLCLDSAKAGALTAWEWAAPVVGSDFPVWDNGLGVSGPRCWTIMVVLIPPVWDIPNPSNVSFNHCSEGSLDLAAHDQDIPPNNPIIYSFAPGFELGTLVGNHWSWSGAGVPRQGAAEVRFLATDAMGLASEPLVVNVTTTNHPPVITCPGLKTLSINSCKTQTVTVADADVCDALTVSLIDNGGAAGDVSMVGNVVEYCPVAGDELLPQPIMMTVQMSDGSATATCWIPWYPIPNNPYQVEIEKVEDQIQGQYTDVFIKLHGYDVTQGVGGFDFLVAYDASALCFQLATEGDIYEECHWEYFTYRFGPNGNCGNACPSGLLRIVGMAETNNGSAHPGCAPSFVGTVPVILANMQFLVTNDRTLECQYVPIRFFWYDCGDNVLSNADGSESYLSQKVFEFTELGEPFLGGEMSDPTVGFPTFQGAQVECFFEDIGKVAKQVVDFQNGGIDIICADSIDAPGDINLNGIPYEIADAVMFTNYFVYGLGAFTNIDGSIAASDTNKDGITLSVADLVYLIRVIVGDALPYAKISPVSACVTVGNGIFSVDQQMGAAFIVVSGDVNPTLLANNMVMDYAFDGQNTNILIHQDFNLKGVGLSFTGAFLQASGSVVSTEFAAFNGAPVTADLMPAEFQLHQNYPNPFNPVTTIKIDVPVRGAEWKLNIYNVTGQLVQSFSGVATGFESVQWDASNVSSGVYFYKLTSGDYSATKKAVLLK